MSGWDTKTVDDTVQEIDDDAFVLPVIQRRMVWDKEQIALLFDTLLKGESFGGIAAIQEDKGDVPLFEVRQFTKHVDVSPRQSIKANDPLSRRKFFIIDGQQRLQALYIGLKGTYDGEACFLNLASDPNEQFELDFSKDASRLANASRTDDTPQAVWYQLSELYERLRRSRAAEVTATAIIQELNISNAETKTRLRRIVDSFFRQVLSEKVIGISTVRLNRNLPDTVNRQKVVELFRRLNQGGTRLSSLDLVASELKGYRWEIERFLDAASRSIADLGFGQDEIVKLTFLLNDNYQKEITNIAENDAKFVTDNQNRLSKTLTALHTFLEAACLAEYYATGNRSAIPLYFICYHIFHSQRTDDQIEKMFEKFDTKGSDFSEIQSWLYWSLLNGAFRGRGAGWTPSTVGTRKILEVMKGHRGKPFPTLELFEVYKKHPLRFFETEIKWEYLDRFDKAFVFYLMYERRRPVRIQDEDHIHPRHLLEGRGVAPVQINSVANLQLLDVGTNRGAKQGKEFADFLAEQVDGRNTYLGRHHIPDEQPLWRVDNFAQFLEERAKLLVRQLSSICPAASTNN